MRMTKYILGLVTVAFATTLVGCVNDPLSPGVEFMPDMYRSPGYETYNANPNYENNMSAQLPAKGTIARGFMPYIYPNTIEGYEAAGLNLKNPMVVTVETENQGKEIYSKMCVHCHGDKGDGAGTIKVKGDPFPVISYLDPAHLALSDGKMFHSITFGKGLMGAHASQLTQEERWKLVAYINKMQRDAAPDAEAAVAPADSTKK